MILVIDEQEQPRFYYAEQGIPFTQAQKASKPRRSSRPTKGLQLHRLTNPPVRYMRGLLAA
jgi:hypothetical protein